MSAGENSPVELSNLEKCRSVIIDSLKQQNPTLVKAVQDLVAELCRITLLWDEMWLAALMQRQGEVHRLAHSLPPHRSYIFVFLDTPSFVSMPLPFLSFSPLYPSCSPPHPFSCPPPQPSPPSPTSLGFLVSSPFLFSTSPFPPPLPPP